MQCVIKTQYQKQKLFLNNFQAGHLLDASGKRTIFSMIDFSIPVIIIRRDRKYVQKLPED